MSEIDAPAERINQSGQVHWRYESIGPSLAFYVSNFFWNLFSKFLNMTNGLLATQIVAKEAYDEF